MIKILEYLQITGNSCKCKKTGILLTDFPGVEMISQVESVNYNPGFAYNFLVYLA